MKLTIFFFLFSSCLWSQTWTSEELLSANTCANVYYLSKNEKEVIQYVNLARMYPSRYAKIELLEVDRTTKYYQSLVKTLNSMKPIPPLSTNKKVFESAKCFALEQSVSGKTGHDREHCDSYFFGECCAYGNETGREVVVQLLVDQGVPSLGHREICLTPEYTFVGVSAQSHKVYQYCCVLDFIYNQ